MRACGGCKACCTVNGIVELRKPERTHCRYECEQGCRRYKTRPKSCKNFNCMWVLGHGDEAGRPDKIGLFVEDRMGKPLGQQLFVKEVVPGASASKEGEAYLQSLYTEMKRRIYLLDATMKSVVGVMG